MTDAPAAGLRVTLNNLFSEHVYLAARATSGAIGNRPAEFEAAAAALDANSVDISKAIGLAYGPDAEAAFLPLWRAHIGMIVDYTTGVATKDEMKQEKAVQDLVGYTQDFAAFLSGANENLPKDAVAELVKGHVLTLQGRRRRPGRRRPGGRLLQPPHGDGPHEDGRRSAGGRHRQEVPGQVRRAGAHPGQPTCAWR